MSRDENFLRGFISLIKQFRMQAGLTIEQLADLAGVHRTTIGLIERGERSPTLAVAQQISNALNVPLHELILEAGSVASGKMSIPELSELHQARTPSASELRNVDQFKRLTGLSGRSLLDAINSCYQTLDVIDEQLQEKDALPIAQLVELANLSSMVGNMLGGGLADHSGGLYQRNKPHTYPDLLPVGEGAVNLELKVALETSKPKGHLPKAGTYITFRYVLADKLGEYSKGKTTRGDTVWIWEVKVGVLTEDDFSISNTAGDSGKTAVIKTDVFNNMALVYYKPNLLPYKRGIGDIYPGHN
ncbi:helix-turn-helix transcriptional regulator [Asticcacaulis sp. SL142]|uniref:helix-turn-helix domain-containing protein n=1 Tax=Asticcacaulis sp. SL142 TaxID=2995155 RepID=UPI00226C71F8|nr:helix-turn-helix transcriptional regulator [Asticcacaulis sp. SL142]WAC48748.1 helix-turn-helix transcriptional regulator [Asticcacaulis sp. SL142]